MNPVQIRNGTATVSVEALRETKVSHWRDLRRLCGCQRSVSQETCLNGVFSPALQVRGSVMIAQKIGCGDMEGVAAVF